MEDLQATTVPEKKLKRKRRDDKEDIEDIYLQKLQDAQEAEDKRLMSKKTKTNAEDEQAKESEEGDSDAEKEEPPIKHESLTNGKDVELDKSSRTVFLGNVPSTAISSKARTPPITPLICHYCITNNPTDLLQSSKNSL